jgi:hypothetical protein
VGVEAPHDGLSVRGEYETSLLVASPDLSPLTGPLSDETPEDVSALQLLHLAQDLDTVPLRVLDDPLPAEHQIKLELAGIACAYPGAVAYFLPAAPA